MTPRQTHTLLVLLALISLSVFAQESRPVGPPAKATAKKESTKARYVGAAERLARSCQTGNGDVDYPHAREHSRGLAGTLQPQIMVSATYT